MAGNSKKAVKAGVGYTIGNILIRGITFLTVPVFSRLMSTDEFGIFNVFLSYESILYVIIGLAIHTSMKSAKIEFPGKIDEYTSSVSLIYIINLAVFLAVACLLGNLIGPLIGFSRAILVMLVVYSFGTAFIALYNHRISLEYSYKKYLTIAFVHTIGNIGLSLIFMLTVFRDDKVMGRISGATLILVVLAAALLYKLYRKAAPKVNREYWKFAIHYSLPIVPHGISQTLLAQFDRIMIQQLVGNSAAGIYSLAGNIKLVLTIISNSISTAWGTWFFEEMEKGNTHEIQKRARQLCGMFAIFTVGLTFLSPEIILILGGHKYMDGKYVAVPMLIDAFVLFVYSVIVQSEYYRKKTMYVMYGTMIAAVINVVTNYIFIRQFGYIAAAYTTLFSYVVYLVLHMCISRRLASFHILELKWLGLYVGLICLSAFVTLYFSDSIPIRYIACAAIAVPMARWLIKDVGVTVAMIKNKLGKRRK